MKYMLDTNICIYAMRSMTSELAERLESCAWGELGISAISLAELEYGVLAGAPERSAALRAKLDSLLEDLMVAPFDADAAGAYATIRRLAPERNRHALDKLIAAHAVGLGAVLVTNNEADFRRFPNLTVENWTQAREV
ncbi:MAG: type II toxin-antitoxin system VapC family toxin [Sulfuritalea sp.]|nr:type II toxin-antitoxin system VapC family toxin [Sulfuritalea sp.]